MCKTFYASAILSVFIGIVSNNLQASEDVELDIGGALRLNYGWKDYDNDSNKSFDFKLFRVDAKLEQGNWF